MTQQKDAEKKVGHFREILFMPLFMNVGKEGFDAIATKDWGQWRLMEDWYQRPQRQGEANPDTCFSEFVYFQPYVQRLLYEKQDSSLVAYYRDDVDTLEIQLGAGDTDTIKLEVAQLNLLWFPLDKENGVAMLVLEVALPTNASLGLMQAEDFLDRFRRLYPPYWDDEPFLPKTKAEAGRFPFQVTWHLKGQGNKPFICDQQKYKEMRDWTKTKRRAPLADHWRWLLSPNNPQHRLFEEAHDSPGGLRQIEDERMPSMAFLAFAEPRKLSRGDFIRLCLADDPGPSDTLPYAPDFLENFEQRYCYDRFWDGDGLRKGTAFNTTRHMNCGYAYTLVGAHGGFFMNATSGILSHFRHHYMVMGLLIHFQRAALLSFSEQLSRAYTKFGKDPATFREFREASKATLGQILNFTDCYWFPEISTQIQARELYDLWRREQNLTGLYDQVLGEAREVTQFLNSKAQEEQAEATKDASERIGKVGILMAAAGALTAGAFGYLKDETKPDLKKIMTLDIDANFTTGLINTSLGLVLAGLIMLFLLHPKVLAWFENKLFGRKGKPGKP